MLFNTYNTDDSGYMDKEEMQVLLSEVFAREFPDRSEAFKRQLYPTDVAMVDLKVFESFARANGSVLFPIFKLQESLQDGLVGRDFWEAQAHKRYVEKRINMDVYRRMFEEIKHGQKPPPKNKDIVATVNQLKDFEETLELKYRSRVKSKSLREMFALPKLIPDEVYEDLRKVKEDREKKKNSNVDTSDKNKGSRIGKGNTPKKSRSDYAQGVEIDSGRGT